MSNLVSVAETMAGAGAVSGKRPLFEIGVKALIPFCSVRGYNQWVYLFLKRARVFEGATELCLDIPGGRLKPGDGSLLAGLVREVGEGTSLKINPDSARKLARQVIERTDDVPVFCSTYLARVLQQGPITLSGEHAGGHAFLSREDALQENPDPWLRKVLSRDELFWNESFSPSEFQMLYAMPNRDLLAWRAGRAG